MTLLVSLRMLPPWTPTTAPPPSKVAEPPAPDGFHRISVVVPVDVSVDDVERNIRILHEPTKPGYHRSPFEVPDDLTDEAVRQILLDLGEHDPPEGRHFLVVDVPNSWSREGVELAADQISTETLGQSPYTEFADVLFARASNGHGFSSTECWDLWFELIDILDASPGIR